MATDDFKNVRISFWNRIKTQYDDAGENVKYEGLDFDTEAVETWVEPQMLSIAGRSRRTSMRNEDWLFQIDHYAKVGPQSSTNPVQIWDLVGITRDSFDQQTFDLKDWDAVGDPTVGYLICKPIDLVEGPTEDDQLLRQIATIRARINQ
jgi:hypothetical protein